MLRRYSQGFSTQCLVRSADEWISSLEDGVSLGCFLLGDMFLSFSYLLVLVLIFGYSQTYVPSVPY